MQSTFSKCSTRTQKKTFLSSQWHRKCIFMPLNVLLTPIPFGIRNVILGAGPGAWKLAKISVCIRWTKAECAGW